MLTEAMAQQSPDGTLTATGHASGSVYLFDNSTSRLTQSLPNLHAPVRAVRFSPGGSLLAAAGDGCIVGVFSTQIGGWQVGLQALTDNR